MLGRQRSPSRNSTPTVIVCGLPASPTSRRWCLPSSRLARSGNSPNGRQIYFSHRDLSRTRTVVHERVRHLPFVDTFLTAVCSAALRRYLVTPHCVLSAAVVVFCFMADVFRRLPLLVLVVLLLVVLIVFHVYEEEEGGTCTVSLGSGSTQEWAAMELCRTGGGLYEQSFTDLLRPGLSGDGEDDTVNLSFGLSTGRSSTPSRTLFVNPHPDDDGGQLTVVDRPSKTRALAREATGADPNPSTQAARASSLSRGASGRIQWVQSPCLRHPAWPAVAAIASTLKPPSLMLVTTGTGGR
ncbi:hypothetical protein CBR_g3708 [Chara braunii]|uniref:Uncharacterized protein n=1 Tax=Chara braunii TaxID=69332 RepID=A0A388KG65_CHABU|nr:hypothetical protein CBR_g3708 [Chara braunii]|eukprot:GBG69008.1 hypothetical protein CBR_g3708 [Chara braunii]